MHRLTMIFRHFRVNLEWRVQATDITCNDIFVVSWESPLALVGKIQWNFAQVTLAFIEEKFSSAALPNHKPDSKIPSKMLTVH